ncbi:sugar ABC transporter ATP-binding protein [Anaerocolumna aminovalerica]|uniref:Monosaccharide ABC transporter ATP-binding protein, CUT2 family n=1 Tax=Anaerocolumna aminovalerica TaxID=1527 RepID=A0A1I5G8G7_9FIRM|nr:sugar ABC transporter ATP-binding protein [Anaerocolumna aminovalerica]MBU5334627.1 sugar ABC transporter ATP-binding protein [Anaerocolumna aminovalerica]MDU6266049.1 sugar ABC transporter ATP-binding protein [Anaerocolumna aminovalerica]SFO32172.1 monosaccharide ABC transporter ATP-binding protein, CUT2 family [Anaerocolumna aminovalerica]
MNEIKLEMKNISIEFPGVKALSDVDFKMTGGTIHALIGANGAGKSTLMKVIAGANTTYTGEIYVDGEPVEIRSPKSAKDLGIEIVFQEVDTALIPYLSVAENVMFNEMVNNMKRKQVVNWKDIRKTAKETLERLNVDLDVNTIVSDLTLAQKQMVLIARCVVGKCRLLILDEPTAPLSNSETEELFRIVRELKKDGVGIIFISHRLNELFEICETITVMRNGKVVENMPITPQLQTKDIVELMLGRKMEENYKKKNVNIGDVLLEVEGLTEEEGRVKNISLNVKRGEIIGIAGLVGAGKTELCKTLFSALKQSSGTVKLNGKAIKYKSPNAAVKHGFALVPEERRREGVLITDPVYSNISIASMKKYTGLFSVVNSLKERKDACQMIKDLGIKTPSENQEVALLSGGNQQKVVLGKWLNSESEIYIFDEPTKGIDVGAKRDMYELIERLVAQGKGVIYASCEFQEILTLADRVYVMYDGEIVKELNVADTDEKELLYFSTGGN